MVKVSVIVPVYNVANYLSRFFDSVQSQSLKDIEIILVDDGSTDDSLKVCQNMADTDSRVKVIHQKNSGSGAARNRGLDVALGKYVYFVDPDDYIDENLLLENYKLAEKYSANLVIFGYFNETISNTCVGEIIPDFSFFQNHHDFEKIIPSLFKKPLIYFVWNKLYLRSSINKLRFEKSRTGQDFRFNLDYIKDASRVICNNKAYYHYIVNRPNSAQNSEELSKRLNKVVDLVNENIKMEHLFFGVWNKKEDLSYISLMNERYLTILRNALNISILVPTLRQRKDYMKYILSTQGMRMFMNNYSSNNLSDKYNLWIGRHCSNDAVLYLDTVLRKLKKRG